MILVICHADALDVTNVLMAFVTTMKISQVSAIAPGSHPLAITIRLKHNN